MEKKHLTKYIKHSLDKMKYKAILFLSLFLLNCQSNNDRPQAYSIDIETTANELTLFGEHVISTALYERDLAISPKGINLSIPWAITNKIKGV